MVAGSPRICMTTTPASHEAATSTIAGSRKPETSLMMLAPAHTAARATSACRVSMLTHMPRSASARTTAMVRASSSSIGTASAPGRVDSPPTSIIWAPSSTKRSAWATAASKPSCSPPSENESGVTFRMPIMTGVWVSKEKPPHFQIMYSSTHFISRPGAASRQGTRFRHQTVFSFGETKCTPVFHLPTASQRQAVSPFGETAAPSPSFSRQFGSASFSSRSRAACSSASLRALISSS